MRDLEFLCWDGLDLYAPTFHEFSDINDQFSDAIFEGILMMQYTGFKDKNGIKIFEDFIFKFPDANGKTIIGVVEFLNGCFYVKHVPLFNIFCLGEVVGHKYQDVEVIENVK